MNMRPVKSTSINSVGYDPATRTMRILFKNGGLYDHANVSEEQHKALMGAKSMGAHYSKNHGKGGVKVTR